QRPRVAQMPRNPPAALPSPPPRGDRGAPLVKMAGVNRLLQRIHSPGGLLRTEHGTAPAAGAHCLHAALADLMHCCVVIHATVPCRWMTPTSCAPPTTGALLARGPESRRAGPASGPRLASDIVRARCRLSSSTFMLR